MGVRRVLVAVAAGSLVTGALVAGAAPASADQLWFQGIPRATVDTPCPENTAEENAAGWPSWEPSWAQWPFNGYGWWVCQRTIDWVQGHGAISPDATQALVDGTSVHHQELGQPGYPVVVTGGNVGDWYFPTLAASGSGGSAG
jgi:hypothetical protein